MSTLANHSKGQPQDFLLIILDLIPMFLPVQVFNAKLLLVVVVLEMEPTKASHMLRRYLTFNPCPQLSLPLILLLGLISFAQACLELTL